MSVLPPEMRSNTLATAQLKFGLMVKKKKRKRTHKVLTEVSDMSHYRLFL